MGHTEGLYQAKAGQEVLQSSLHDVSGLPGTEHSTDLLLQPRRRAEGPQKTQRPRSEPSPAPQGTMRTIPQRCRCCHSSGARAVHGQSSRHMRPLLLERTLPWVTAGLRQLAAPQGEPGEVNPSLQPETREENAALGLGQHKEAQFPLPVKFISIIPGLKHNRSTQKVAANSEDL